MLMRDACVAVKRMPTSPRIAATGKVIWVDIVRLSLWSHKVYTFLNLDVDSVKSEHKPFEQFVVEKHYCHVHSKFIAENC